MKSAPIALALAMTLQCACAAEFSDALVEKTLGVSGVKHTAKTQTKYGMTYSDVVYKDGTGQELVTLRLGGPEQYSLWKQYSGPDSAPVSGVGSEAFQMKALRSICAKGTTVAACVTPDYLLNPPKITNDQLVVLLKAAI